MENKKSRIQLPIQFDLINEIIFKSIIIILFGIAYLFAFNLLRVNLYTIFFALLLLILIYLKKQSYLKIDKDYLEIHCFKYYQKVKLKIREVTEIVFYNQHSFIEIKTKNGAKVKVYLKNKNKEKLLNWIIKNCPDIRPIYIDKIKKDS